MQVGRFLGRFVPKGPSKNIWGWRARPGLAGHPKNGSQNHEIVIEIGRGGFYGGFSEEKGSYTLN